MLCIHQRHNRVKHTAMLLLPMLSTNKLFIRYSIAAKGNRYTLIKTIISIFPRAASTLTPPIASKYMFECTIQMKQKCPIAPKPNS